MEIHQRAMIGLVLLASVRTVQADVPRTPSGKPDLTGTYDTGTLTPLQRPEFLGEIEYLYAVSYTHLTLPTILLV